MLTTVDSGKVHTAEKAADVNQAYSTWTKRNLDILRFSIVALLLGSGAFIAADVVYLRGRQNEHSLFEAQFDTYVQLMTSQLTNRVDRLVSAVGALQELFDGRRPWDFVRADNTTVPAVSYKSFSQAAINLRVGSPFIRAFLYAPYVTTPSYRLFVENFLRNETALNVFGATPEQQAIIEQNVANGITYRNATNISSLLRVPDFVITQRALTPLVFIAPLIDDENSPNYQAIGYDISSEPERFRAAQRAVQTRQAILTGFLELIVQDTTPVDPTAAASYPLGGGVYSPVFDEQNLEGGPSGLLTAYFSWRRVVGDILPANALSTYVVISTPNWQNETETVTFLIRKNVSVQLGDGRLVEKNFERYVRKFRISNGGGLQNYDFEIYPSAEMQASYVSNDPRNLCIIVMAFAVFVASVFILYDVFATAIRKRIRNIAVGAYRVLDDILPAHVNRRVVGENIIDFEGSVRPTRRGSAAAFSPQAANKFGSHATLYEKGVNGAGGSSRRASTEPYSEREKTPVEHVSVYVQDGTGIHRSSDSEPQLLAHNQSPAPPPSSRHLNLLHIYQRSPSKRISHQPQASTLTSDRGSTDHLEMMSGSLRQSHLARMSGLPNASIVGGHQGPTTAGVIADFHPMCSVLFLDIVGFTSWSSEQSPTRILSVLDILFGEIDRVAETFDTAIYKIDTVGDALIAVSGCPKPNRYHARDICDFALAILHNMDRVRAKTGLSDLRIRIGINAGPLTAGVLRSSKRLKFSVYGDTVNVAARCEATSEPMRIQVTEIVYDLLKDDGEHTFEERGLVDMRGKGKVKTYWLLGSSRPIARGILPYQSTHFPNDPSKHSGSTGHSTGHQASSMDRRLSSSFDLEANGAKGNWTDSEKSAKTMAGFHT